MGGARSTSSWRSAWTPRRRQREALTCLVPLLALVVGAGVFVGLRVDPGLPPAYAAHAALMLAAWGVLLPAGAVLARYGKVTADQRFPLEVDNPYWWNWHRGLQYTGVGIATLAFALILTQTGGRFLETHSLVGLAVLLAGWGQVLAGWLRGSKGGPTDRLAHPEQPDTWRGDHYDMTLRRRLFERWHKTVGWTCLVASGVAVVLGIVLVGAPGWLLAVAGMLHGAAALAVLDGAVRGRWVDTYVALWGFPERDPDAGARSAGGHAD